MFKLTLPEEDNFYSDLVDHPNVVRVVALSGGYSREEGNERIALGMDHRRMDGRSRPQQRRRAEDQPDRNEQQAEQHVAAVLAELDRQYRRQHDRDGEAHQAEHFAPDRDARALVVVVAEFGAMAVVADRHARIAEMRQQERRDQPYRHQRLVADPGVGRIEQHEEAAGQHRRHQRDEGEAPTRPAPREAVADQADHRILDRIDDAGEDEDRAHDGERKLQHLAVEMADIEHHRQGRHSQRQLQGRIGHQPAEFDFCRRGGAVPGRSCIHPGIPFAPSCRSA